jgi:hypothetical protein
VAKRESFVHFTHHTCVVTGQWRTASEAEIRARDPLDISGRNPSLSVCRYWIRVSKHKAGAWTIDPAAVTCSACRSGLAAESEASWNARSACAVMLQDRQYYSNWRSDRDLITCAWLSCCRHRGAPWPYSDEAKAQAEAWYRRKIYETPFVDAMDAWTHINMRDSVLERYASFDDATKAQVAPALDMYLLAADQLDGAHLAMRQAAAIAARELGIEYDHERGASQVEQLDRIRSEITDQILNNEEAA